MPNNHQIIAILVLGTFFVSMPAYGYIDPGTGSLIIQGVIGAIAAIGVTMKIYWHKIKVFFSGRSNSGDTGKEPAEDTSGKN